MKAACLLTLGILIAGACSTAPTPIAPGSAPTIELNTMEPPQQQSLIYKLIIEPEWIEAEDLQQLNETGTVVFSSQFEPDSALADNSIEATYGLVDTWQPSNGSLNAVLLLHPDLFPLSPALSDFIAESLPNLVFETRGAAISGNLTVEAGTGLSAEQSRTMLANMGFPDGLPLRLIAAPLPGRQMIVDLLASYGIDLTTQERSSSQETLDGFLRREGHLALINATAIDLDEIYQINLYSLPISFRSNISSEIGFTPGGWPFIPRSDN